jgi:hypothetical protein
MNVFENNVFESHVIKINAIEKMLLKLKYSAEQVSLK